MNTKIIRKHFFFKGRVQGVGFRYRAQNAACILPRSAGPA